MIRNELYNFKHPGDSPIGIKDNKNSLMEGIIFNGRI